ncbi:MAG: ATP-binding protein [Solirubrobacteraceae bacterium]
MNPSSARAPRAAALQGACPFGLCDGSGFVVDEAENVARDCSCRTARVARIRAAALQGRIPTRYSGVSFDRPPVPSLPEPVVAEVRRYVRDVSQRLQEGRGLWFVGDPGTGKTTLAMLVSKAALEAGHSVAIYSLPRLLNLIHTEMDQDHGLLELYDSLASIDLLHVDDLGGHTTPWRLEQLYSVIDARYQESRAVVATTNLLPDDLGRQWEEGARGARDGTDQKVAEGAERVGRRIVSRLIEICGDPLPLFGEDMRRALRPPSGFGAVS